MNTQKPAMKLQPSPNSAGRWLLDGRALTAGDKIGVKYFSLWHLAEVQFDKEQNIYVLVLRGTMAISGQLAHRL